MPDPTGDSTPPKRAKQNAEQIEKSGHFEFASERVATMVFHSFGHDEDPPRSAKIERELAIDGNRLKFRVAGNNEKLVNKTVESLAECAALAQSVLAVAARPQFGGRLDDAERKSLAEPLVRAIDS